MKKFWVLLILMVAMIAVPDDADAQLEQRDRTRQRGGVGAPLDGGLLTILGAAGVAYYVARKKKKQVE